MGGLEAPYKACPLCNVALALEEQRDLAKHLERCRETDSVLRRVVQEPAASAKAPTDGDPPVPASKA